MFYNFLLVILVIDAVILIAAILLQSGKGGGLAANFGGASSAPDAFVGIRQAGTILTKATWWCGGIFLALALILSVMSASRSGVGGRSSLQERLRQNSAPATQEAPVPLPLQGTTQPPAGEAAPPAGAPAEPQPQPVR